MKSMLCLKALLLRLHLGSLFKISSRHPTVVVDNNLITVLRNG